MARKVTDEITQTASQAVAIVDENMNDIIPLQSVPDYLQDEAATGLESFSKEDYKVPRIKLLDSSSPEVKTFPGKAIPGDFWHTGANQSIGTEFRFIPCLASKRVILFAPRNSDHEGMLAFSRDSVNWDVGANKKFEIKVQKIPNKLIWETGKNVKDSGLLEWGTFNQDDDESGPAAQLSYEYLLYLPDMPHLSPVVMSTFRTALTNAKNLNTNLLMIRKPIQSVMVRCFSDAKADGDYAWFVPGFELKGFVSKELYAIAKDIYEKQKDYQTTYTPEDAKPTIKDDDTIPF